MSAILLKMTPSYVMFMQKSEYKEPSDCFCTGNLQLQACICYICLVVMCTSPNYLLSRKGCSQPAENKICKLSVPVCLSCATCHVVRDKRSSFVSVFALTLCETQLYTEDHSFLHKMCFPNIHF